MAKTLVGTDYAPPDLIEKITGRAKYAEDWRAEGMLFAKQLLSPMPHARVRNIDASAALAMEGVEAVLTADDLAEFMGEAGPLDERALTNHPKYEGEPVLAVAAVSEKIAADAIEKINVDFEPLPFALDPLDSIAPGGANSLPDGNSIIRQRTDTGMETVVERVEWTAEDLATARGSNGEKGRMPEGVFQDEWTNGDLEKGFADADYIIDEPLFFQSVTHHPMEPRSCMAHWDGDTCHLYPSTQSVAFTLLAGQGTVGVPMQNLVVHAEYTGGGFGSKIVGSSNMAVPVYLAKMTGKPVMHRVTRYEENYIGRARPGFQGWARIGFKNDGRISAFDWAVIQDNGPYGRQSDMGTSGNMVSLTYQPESMRHRGLSIATNTPPRAPQRAPGGVQMSAMVEPLLDRAADHLGIDRLTIRQINIAKNGAKFGEAEGRNVTTAYVTEAWDRLAEMVDWEDARARSGQMNGSKVTGVGLASSTYTAGSSGFDGLMLITPEGRLQIHTGIGNLGTHSYSDTARVAADLLDVPWEKVDMVWGQTGEGIPHTCVQAGSQTTHAITRATHAAATDMKTKLQEIAAQVHGGSASQYVVAGERVYRRGNRAAGLSLAQAAEKALELGGRYDGTELNEGLSPITLGGAAVLKGKGLLAAAKDNYGRAGDVYSWVVAYAEIELDKETGVIELTDYKAVTDCGTVLNPRSLGGQLHGGAVQGFGCAVGQKWVYDPQWGIPFANRFYTARPATILDVPLEMEWDAVNMPDPNNPVGSKGIGEPPMGAGCASLLCAIQDALGQDTVAYLPLMTDHIINQLEGREQDSEFLAAHT